jgi:hypothetical protein
VPVFIALVDVTQRKAYWLFAQRYLRENAGAARLDSKNTFGVTFDVADCFSDHPRFTEAVKAAEHYLRNLYPGAPVAAVEQRRQALQKLDPKIGVNVSVQAGVCEDELASEEQERRIIVEKLDAIARRAANLLAQAENVSTMPDALGPWAGQSFLRIAVPRKRQDTSSRMSAYSRSAARSRSASVF